jgi:phospholipase/carboxylesterase
MSKALSNFVHVFQDQGSAKTLFLLHGTGGSELDLIPLVENVQGMFNLVGLRGNISEGGMARFFIRKASGVFDQASIASESKKLAAFLSAWHKEHETSAENAAFVGYSNGANMVLATLLRYPDMIHKAALLHPMMPFDPPPVDLKGKRFLVTHGLNDTMMPPGEADRVITALQERGAQVSAFSHPGEHHLTYEEQTALLDFLRVS